MLTANCNGLRVDAQYAMKGFTYYCPRCVAVVTLRQGQIKAAHFAHKPPTSCSWATGETSDHLAAKVLLRDALRAQGYLANYEVEVLSVSGDRRADVLATSPDGLHRWAFEIQHTPILYPAIESRTKSYMAANVPVLWAGLLSSKMKSDAEQTATGLIIRKYTIKPWEKWAKALAFNELWYVDPSSGNLWRGQFSPHQIHVAATSWFESGGIEQSAGGYDKTSKRWRTLNLHGPYTLSQLTLRTNNRAAWSSPAFSLPAGPIAVLSVL